MSRPFLYQSILMPLLQGLCAIALLVSCDAQSEGRSAEVSAHESGSAASDSTMLALASQTKKRSTTGVAPFGQNPDDYILTFADEFETSLNRKVWNDTTWDKPSNPTKNYTVENGSLKIWPQRDASGQFFPRVIDTDGKFYQTYGYFEIEAKLPVGKGTWPAFWLYNHDDEKGSFRPEIDIMEAYAGGGPDSGWSDARLRPTAYSVTIWSGQPEVKAGMKMLQDVGDLSAKFHKYALKWEPHKQTFYFDGKEIYSLDIAMPDRMYLMLDLLFGSASGDPDHTTPTGKNNSFEVKYVRVWQFRKPPSPHQRPAEHKTRRLPG